MKKYPLLFLAAAFFILPLVSSAHDGHYHFTRDLTLKSFGEDVRQLQIFLNDQGFLVRPTGEGSPGKESIYFGTATRDALAKFQAANNISPASGYLGAKTRTAISSPLTTATIAANATTITANLNKKSTGKDVIILQNFLKSKGYLTVAYTEGKFDSATSKALKKYSGSSTLTSKVRNKVNNTIKASSLSSATAHQIDHSVASIVKPVVNVKPVAKKNKSNKSGGGGVAAHDPIHVSDPTPIPIDERTISNTGMWSNPATWKNGTVPTISSKVFIPVGKTVTVDTDINVASIVAEGALLVPDTRDINITAGFIVASSTSGKFLAGSFSAPFMHKLTITLNGTDAKATPAGGRVLAAIQGGELAVIGPKPTFNWTMLNANANAGVSSITVEDLVDWKIGDRIIITSTSLDYSETEEAVITGINGKNISLSSGLKHSHNGAKKYYASEVEGTTVSPMIDTRAEVALLTHPIKIQGSADSDSVISVSNLMNAQGSSVSTTDGFGGQTMVMGTGSVGNFQGVELYRMGQKNITGRYPIHWHNVNDGGINSLVRGSSVRDSYSRCYTIHKTSGVKVEDNVGYNTLGHCYFVEDGKEINNTFTHNIGASVKKGTLLGSDNHPAVFWMTNANNDFVNNSAAGTVADGIGFWFDLPETPAANTISTDSNYFPRRQQAGIFRGNRAHSIALTGSAHLGSWGVWSNVLGSQEPIFEDFTTFSIGGVSAYFVLGGDHLLDHPPMPIVKNSHFESDFALFVSGKAVLKDSLVVASTPNPQLSSQSIATLNSYDGVARAVNSVFVNQPAVFTVGPNTGSAAWCASCKFVNSYMIRPDSPTIFVPDPNDSFGNGASGAFVNASYLADLTSPSPKCKGLGTGAKGIYPNPSTNSNVYWCPGAYSMAHFVFYPASPSMPANGAKLTAQRDNETPYVVEMTNHEGGNGIYKLNSLNRIQFEDNRPFDNLIEIRTGSNSFVEVDSDEYAFPVAKDDVLLFAVPAPSGSLSIIAQEFDLAGYGLTPIRSASIPQSSSKEAFDASRSVSWFIDNDKAGAVLYLKTDPEVFTRLTLTHSAPTAKRKTLSQVANIFKAFSTFLGENNRSTTTVPVISGAIFPFHRTLRENDSGEDVRALQEYLNNLGFTVSTSGPGSKGLETTIFGGKTREALKKWQVSVGLPETGFFGDMSLRKIRGGY